MGINKKLLPVKAHYFFFMAASGPILPFLTVYGKELGISEVWMGSITAVVPVTFLLAKPMFGYIADYFYNRRKLIFMVLVASVAVFYLSLYLIPPVNIELQYLRTETNMSEMKLCNELEKAGVLEGEKCNVSCSSGCRFLGILTVDEFCYYPETAACNESDISSECHDNCLLQTSDGKYLFRSVEFYGFVILMTFSMIAFNVSNSISDAICFDVLGEVRMQEVPEGRGEGSEMKYGFQRMWGTVGFGVTAFLGGVGMDLGFRGEANIKNYTPAFALVFILTCIDMFCCLKLKLPKMAISHNILKDLSKVLKNKTISIFLIFATLVGILDGFVIFFMFWFLEDLAKAQDEIKHIKVLEGLTVAAETLGGEILFFLLSGKILSKLGYGNTLSLCFFNYALRLGLISIISNPWWILAVEFFMQGPTYALCYTTIVAYANTIAPAGTSATMQGIVAGMDDGFGYALGSLMGGFLYKALGGRLAFRVFSLLALICCLAHMIMYKFFLSKSYQNSQSCDYEPPSEAFQMMRTKLNSSQTETYGINSAKS